MEELFVLLAVMILFLGVVTFVMCLVAITKIRQVGKAQKNFEWEVAERMRAAEQKLIALDKARFAQAPPADQAEELATQSEKPVSVAPQTPRVPEPPVSGEKPLGGEKVPPREAPSPQPPPIPPRDVSPEKPAFLKPEKPADQALPSQNTPPQPPSPQPAGAGMGPQTSIGSPPPVPPQAKIPPQRGPLPEPKPAFDLEQWLGVRGAAVLGGIVLALAGIYLFKYSIDNKLLSPPMRVALGLVTGLVCTFGSALLRKRQFVLPANGLAGGGLVILYGSVWAAHGLYELIHSLVAFLAMVAITLSCGILALKHRSRFVAMLGLFGGFVTPIMVSTGEARTFELFGYLFLLNLGLLALAKKMQLPLLAYVSIAATGFYQLFFLSEHLMDAGPEVMLGVITVFGLLFLVSGYIFGRETGGWPRVRLLGMGSALLLGLIPVLQDVPLTFTPLAIMLGCLSAGACWIAYRQNDGVLVRVAGLGTAIFLWIWFLGDTFPQSQVWWVIGAMVVLVAIYAWSYRWVSSEGQNGQNYKGFRDGFLAMVVGCQLLFIAASVTQPATFLLAWLVGWLAMSAFVIWQTRQGFLAAANVWHGISLSIALGLFAVELGTDANFPSPTWFLLGTLGLGIILFLMERLTPDDRGRLWANRGAALFPLIFLGLSLWTHLTPFTALALLLARLVLFILAVWGAKRCQSGWFYLATMILGIWVFYFQMLVDLPKWDESGYFLAGLGFSGLMIYFPFCGSAPFKAKRLVWLTAAWTPVFLFPVYIGYFSDIFGEDWLGLLPVGLGLLTLGGALLCYRQSLREIPGTRFGTAWLAAITIGFFTCALPLQFDKSWLTIAFALETLGLIMLWVRLRHPGLKYAAFAVFSVVFLRLVFNPFLFDYYPESQGRIFTWLMYTYLVPVGASLVAAFVLRRREIANLVPKEMSLYRNKKPFLSGLMIFGVIVMFFVYLNLGVFQYFSGSGPLEFSLVRQPARDLTLSMVWAGYGLFLMALGIRTKTKALRRVSLGMVILTICKVFLYDLGELTDLYRAASLFGLAISLLLVSVAYQKFVAGAKATPEASSAEEG